MSTCEHFEELMSAQIDGALSKQEQQILEQHLETCPSCRRMAAELSRLHPAFVALSVPPAQDFSSAVRCRLQREKRKSRTRRYLASAAVLAVLVVGSVAALSPFGNSGESEMAYAASGGDCAAAESPSAEEGEAPEAAEEPAEASAGKAKEEMAALSENRKIEAAPAAEDSAAPAEEYATSAKNAAAAVFLTEQEAQGKLAAFLSLPDAVVTPLGLSEDGQCWRFSVQETGETVYAVSRQNGEIWQETAAFSAADHAN